MAAFRMMSITMRPNAKQQMCIKCIFLLGMLVYGHKSYKETIDLNLIGVYKYILKDYSEA